LGYRIEVSEGVGECVDGRFFFSFAGVQIASFMFRP